MYPPLGWQVVAGGSSLSGENWAQNRWRIENIFGFVIVASRLTQFPVVCMEDNELSANTLKLLSKQWLNCEKCKAKVNILRFWFACKPFFLNKVCLETASNHLPT